MTDIVLLDGSIGQEIVKRAGEAPTPLWSTSVMIDHPEIVSQVHADYFRVGSTIATTNTYAVLYDRLKKAGLEDRITDLWDAAVMAAKSAKDAHGSGRIAASVGPLMASYRPDICPPATAAEGLYDPIIKYLEPHVDLFLIETMSSVDQADGALRAACKSQKPVWVSVTVDDFDGTRLRSGEAVAVLNDMLKRHTAQAILVNCSRPEVIVDTLAIVRDFGLPFGAYANGFTRITQEFLKDSPTVAALQERVDLTPEAYAKHAMAWIDAGATIVGGCCEVGPDHIQELANQIRAAGHTIV